MKKKILASILAFSMVFGVLGIENTYNTKNFTNIRANAEENTEELTTGSCGENVTYSFDKATGTLTISGTGDMYDFSSNGPLYNDESANRPAGVSPFSNKADIKKVIIENGVTNIGDCTFHKCTNMTEIKISDSVKIIKGGVFDGCTSLTNVTISENCERIESGAFANCESLAEIKIPDSVEVIYDKAFTGCQKLLEITFPDNIVPPIKS